MPENDDKGRVMRKHPRIAWGFMVRHKLQGQPDEPSELSTVKNISVGGCNFSSPHPYEVSQVVDLRVKLPGVPNPLAFQGQVRRCEAGDVAGVWFIAVEFMNMEAAQKDEFSRVMAFFIKKQNKR